jgi:hypothetical protein
MISIKNKVIFTHPPRCGGTSFEFLLGMPDSGEHFEKYKHASLTEHLAYLSELNLNKNDFKKISIIRNPWERVVSWYFFIKNRKNPWARRTFFQNAVEKYGFNEFVTFLDQNFKKNHFLKRPYSFYMRNEHQFDINFVIRYENYYSDVSKALDLLNVKYKNTIPRLRSGGAGCLDYKQFYNEKTKKIVDDIYRDDIDFFGYTF